jgi:hypothetical protein
MPEHRHHDPGSTFEEEGIPDLQEGTPEQQRSMDPQEHPLPTDRPTGADRWGTTPNEWAQGEPLEDRLRQEEPDVGAVPAGRYSDSTPTEERGDATPLGRPTSVAPGRGRSGDTAEIGETADPGSRPAWPNSEPDAVGRLADPDRGAGEDREPDAVADEFGADGGGFSAEERAMHVRDEPPLESHGPGYVAPEETAGASRDPR